MKVAWRVLYIIYATILLLVIGSIARKRQEQLYFENEGSQALASSNSLEKFYFFYGAMGYHYKEPTELVQNEQFEMAFFEIYREEERDSYFYIMLFPKPDFVQPSDRILYQLSFKFYEPDKNDETLMVEKTKTFDFDRFQNLGIYVLVNSSRQALITVDEIQNISPTHMTVIKKYKQLNEAGNGIDDKVDEFPFLYTIKSKDLIIKETIEQVGMDKEVLNELGIYQKHSHILKKYAYIFYLSITATLIVIVLGAYFLFFFGRGKRSNLGRTKPTKAFENFGEYQDYYDPLATKDDNKDSKK